MLKKIYMEKVNWFDKNKLDGRIVQHILECQGVTDESNLIISIIYTY